MVILIRNYLEYGEAGRISVYAQDVTMMVSWLENYFYIPVVIPKSYI